MVQNRVSEPYFAWCKTQRLGALVYYDPHITWTVFADSCSKTEFIRNVYQVSLRTEVGWLGSDFFFTSTRSAQNDSPKTESVRKLYKVSLWTTLNKTHFWLYLSKQSEGHDYLVVCWRAWSTTLCFDTTTSGATCNCGRQVYLVVEKPFHKMRIHYYIFSKCQHCCTTYIHRYIC